MAEATATAITFYADDPNALPAPTSGKLTLAMSTGYDAETRMVLPSTAPEVGSGLALGPDGENMVWSSAGGFSPDAAITAATATAKYGLMNVVTANPCTVTLPDINSADDVGKTCMVVNLSGAAIAIQASTLTGVDVILGPALGAAADNSALVFHVVSYNGVDAGEWVYFSNTL